MFTVSELERPSLAERRRLPRATGWVDAKEVNSGRTTVASEKVHLAVRGSLSTLQLQRRAKPHQYGPARPGRRNSSRSAGRL